MLIDDATPADIPALCDLLALLFAQEAEFSPDRAAQERGLQRIVGHPEIGRVRVARDGERVVGTVMLLFTVSTVLGERVALLEDMVVAPQARGAGIGSRLLQSAIATARDAGCRRITVLTDHVNTSAQRFYARHGFTDSPMRPLRLAL